VSSRFSWPRFCSRPISLAYANLHAEESLARTSRELAKGSFTLAGPRVAHSAPSDVESRVRRTSLPRIAVTLSRPPRVVARGGPRAHSRPCGMLLLFWLGLGEPGGLYRLIGGIPPFASMRHPVTLTAVAVMFLSVLAAFGLSRLQTQRPSAAWLVLADGRGRDSFPRERLSSPCLPACLRSTKRS
jgi:hypothetical protein